MRIEDYIPNGKESAVTRTVLMEKTGLSDRKVRDKIACARKSGVVIINDQTGAGYYRPTIAEYEEAMQQYRQERSRAMKILARNKGLSSWLSDVKNNRLKVGG